MTVQCVAILLLLGLWADGSEDMPSEAVLRAVQLLQEASGPRRLVIRDKGRPTEDEVQGNPRIPDADQVPLKTAGAGDGRERQKNAKSSDNSKSGLWMADLRIAASRNSIPTDSMVGGDASRKLRFQQTSHGFSSRTGVAVDEEEVVSTTYKKGRRGRARVVTIRRPLAETRAAEDTEDTEDEFDLSTFDPNNVNSFGDWGKRLMPESNSDTLKPLDGAAKSRRDKPTAKTSKPKRLSGATLEGATSPTPTHTSRIPGSVTPSTPRLTSRQRFTPSRQRGIDSRVNVKSTTKPRVTHRPRVTSVRQRGTNNKVGVTTTAKPRATTRPRVTTPARQRGTFPTRFLSKTRLNLPTTSNNGAIKPRVQSQTSANTTSDSAQDLPVEFDAGQFNILEDVPRLSPQVSPTSDPRFPSGLLRPRPSTQASPRPTQHQSFSPVTPTFIRPRPVTFPFTSAPVVLSSTIPLKSPSPVTAQQPAGSVPTRPSLTTTTPSFGPFFSSFSFDRVPVSQGTASPPAVTPTSLGLGTFTPTSRSPSVTTSFSPVRVTSFQPSLVTSPRPSLFTSLRPSLFTMKGTQFIPSNPSTFPSPRPATFTSPGPATFTSPRPATLTSPRPPTFTSPSPATFTSPRPLSFASPSPATFTSPRPLTFASPSPATFTSPRPPTFTTPRPPTFTSPSPPTFSAPSPPRFSPLRQPLVTSLAPSHFTSHPSMFTSSQPTLFSSQFSPQFTSPRPLQFVSVSSPVFTSPKPHLANSAGPVAVTTPHTEAVTPSARPLSVSSSSRPSGHSFTSINAQRHPHNGFSFESFMPGSSFVSSFQLGPPSESTRRHSVNSRPAVRQEVQRQTPISTSTSSFSGFPVTQQDFSAPGHLSSPGPSFPSTFAPSGVNFAQSLTTFGFKRLPPSSTPVPPPSSVQVSANSAFRLRDKQAQSHLFETRPTTVSPSLPASSDRFRDKQAQGHLFEARPTTVSPSLPASSGRFRDKQAQGHLFEARPTTVSPSLPASSGNTFQFFRTQHGLSREADSNSITVQPHLKSTKAPFFRVFTTVRPTRTPVPSKITSQLPESHFLPDTSAKPPVVTSFQSFRARKPPTSFLSMTHGTSNNVQNNIHGSRISTTPKNVAPKGTTSPARSNFSSPSRTSPTLVPRPHTSTTLSPFFAAFGRPLRGETGKSHSSDVETNTVTRGNVQTNTLSLDKLHTNFHSTGKVQTSHIINGSVQVDNIIRGNAKNDSAEKVQSSVVDALNVQSHGSNINGVQNNIAKTIVSLNRGSGNVNRSSFNVNRGSVNANRGKVRFTHVDRSNVQRGNGISRNNVPVNRGSVQNVNTNKSNAQRSSSNRGSDQVNNISRGNNLVNKFNRVNIQRKSVNREHVQKAKDNRGNIQIKNDNIINAAQSHSTPQGGEGSVEGGSHVRTLPSPPVVQQGGFIPMTPSPTTPSDPTFLLVPPAPPSFGRKVTPPGPQSPLTSLPPRPTTFREPAILSTTVRPTKSPAPGTFSTFTTTPPRPTTFRGTFPSRAFTTPTPSPTNPVLHSPNNIFRPIRKQSVPSPVSQNTPSRALTTPKSLLRPPSTTRPSATQQPVIVQHLVSTRSPHVTSAQPKTIISTGRPQFINFGKAFQGSRQPLLLVTSSPRQQLQASTSPRPQGPSTTRAPLATITRPTQANNSKSLSRAFRPLLPITGKSFIFVRNGNNEYHVVWQ